MLSIAYSNYQWAPTPCSNQLARVVQADYSQAISSINFIQRSPYGVFQRLFKITFNKMGNHLRICFTLKKMSFFFQFCFQIVIIFNNTVVDYCNPSGTIKMWVGILIVPEGLQ